MTNVDRSFVTVRTMAETNSVKWKLNIASTPALSSKVPYLKLNDSNAGTGYPFVDNALNLRVLKPLGVSFQIDAKSYALTPNDTSISNSFVEYMNSLPAGNIVCFISKGNLRSTQIMDDWFKNANSVVYPKQFLCNKFNYSYAAFYSTTTKKIIQECYHGENQTANSGEAVLETVFDTLVDIGATGYARSAVYDPKEYVTTSEYEFKRYPDNLLVAKLSDYGLTAGSTVMLSCELYQSKELVDAGLVTRINLRWYKGTTLLDSSQFSPPVNKFDQWVKYQQTYSTIPETADGFIIVAARYPRNDAVLALGSIRNVSLCQVSRIDGKAVSTSIGVNGYRTTDFNESALDPLLVRMIDASKTTENKLLNVEMKEEENPY